MNTESHRDSIASTAPSGVTTANASPLDKIIPPQKPPRASLYRTQQGTKTLDDLLEDAQLRASFVDFWQARDLRWDRVYTDDVEEHKDEFVRLMEELNLLRADWRSLQEQTYKPIGHRLIPIAYQTSEIRNVLDEIQRIEAALVGIKTYEEEKAFFKKRRAANTGQEETAVGRGKLAAALAKLCFDEGGGKITFGEKFSDVPKGTYQYYFCKKMFDTPCGTRVGETDILQVMDFVKGEEESKRTVYDAMRAVNQRAKEDLDIEELFHWRNNTIWMDERDCTP